MDDNIAKKTELWADRIRAFLDSGLSRKDWCQQNGIPQSTFSYWFRKQSRRFCRTDPYYNRPFRNDPDGTGR